MKKLLSIAVGLLLSVQSFSQVIMSESFKNSTMSPSWHLVPLAALTAGAEGEGNGWLRLSDAGQGWSPGAAYSDQTFDFNNGGIVSFDYTIWGGSGADGMALVFFDGNEASYGVGSAGGSIGYLDTPTNTYAAVGISVYPTSFSNNAPENNIAVRGSKVSNFQHLYSINPSFLVGYKNDNVRPDQTSEQYRRIIVSLSPDRKISVSMIVGYGNEPQEVITDLDVSAHFPENLSNIKLAFSAAFGGLNDNFEVRNLEVALFSSVSTGIATNRTETSAQLNGFVNPRKSETVVHFLYGSSPEALTDSIPAVQSPLSSTDSTFISVSAPLSSLEANSTYYFTVTAVNDSGYAVGTTRSFKTLPTEPTEQATVSAQSIQKFSAQGHLIGGNGDSRLVVISANSEYDWSPVDGVNYAYNSNILNSTPVDSLTYVIYAGIDSVFTIQGLTDSTTYTMYVYEKNGDGELSNYKTDNPGTATFTTLEADFKIKRDIGLAGYQYSAHAWADLNDDGFMDFIFSAQDDSYLYIAYSNGDGTFADAEEIEINSGYKPSITVRNFDLDTEPEILVVNNNSIQIVDMNDGVWSANYLPVEGGFEENAVAVFDYDLDGDLDVMVTGTMNDVYSDKHIPIFRNDGNLNFIRVQTNLLSVGDGEIGIGDFNEDGYPDAFITGTDTYYYSGRIAMLYFGNGTNNFTQSQQSFSGTYRGGLKVGYLDSDSHLDIVYFGATGQGNRESHILFGDGVGNFEDSVNPFSGLALSSLDIGDVDNDGDTDILTAGTPDSKQTAYTRIIRNDNGEFTQLETDDFDGYYYSSVSLVDYDNDGKLDVYVAGTLISSGGEEPRLTTAIAGGNYPNFSFYKNNLQTGYNQPPTAPLTLSGVVEGNEISLSWSGATDDLTDTTHLAYNILIFGASEEVPFVYNSNSYSMESSHTLVRNSGNTLQRNSLKLKNLLPGTYYFGVQSIDGGYDVSPFSDVDSFTVVSAPIAQGPTNLYYETYGEHSLSLYWNSLEKDGVDHYDVYEIMNGEPTFIGEGQFGEIGNYFDIDSVSIGSVHHYQVKAVFTDETESEFSEVLTAGYYSFYQETTSLPTFYYKTYKWADINADGNLDVVGVYNSSVYVWIYTGINEGGQAQYNSYQITSDDYDENTNIQVGDIDNDGDVDIAVLYRYSIKIYRNDGQTEEGFSFNLNYEEYTDDGYAYYTPFGLFTDVNNDGFVDFLISGFDYSYKMIVLYNRQSLEEGRVFERMTMENVEGLENGVFDAADIDHDGDLDVLINGHVEDDENERYSRLLINDGNDSTRFSVSSQFFTGSYKGFAKFADLNNDGFADLIINGSASSGQRMFRIHKNIGDGTFTVVPSFIAGTALGTFDVADMNNDGLSDLVLVGTPQRKGDQQLYVYYNVGDFKFTPVSLSDIDVFLMADVNLIDMDHDGDLDIFTTGEVDGGGGEAVSKGTSSKSTYIELGNSGIIWNHNTVSNTAPTAPTTFNSTVDGNKVDLSWSGAADDHTAANGLQYNVFVINNIYSESETTFPFDAGVPINHELQTLSLLGVTNTGFNSAFTLNLPLEGDYQWYVQTVDNGRKSSEIVQGGLFHINQTVPVELASFKAVQKNATVELQWSTQTETNNYGYEVEKQNTDLTWKVLGFVKGNGTSTEVHHYQFTDGAVSEKATYRLKLIDTDGKFAYSELLSFTAEKPTALELSQNYPNPFNPSTTIRYTVPFSGMVKLTVYDILGRELTNLVNEVKEAGFYEIPFNASSYSSGVYYYRIEFNGLSQIKKMTLLK